MPDSARRREREAFGGIRLLRLSVFLAGLLAAGAIPSRAQAGKIEALPRLQDAAVSEAVRGSLQDAGYRIRLDDGSVAAEIWFRSQVPVQPASAVEGVVYPQIPESTLLGVLHFPAAASDYRGQAIPAGYYTLRYELMPTDGNHLGAAPDRDFLLLIPAAADSDPNAQFKYAELVSLSRQAAGSKHPAPLSLVDATGGHGPDLSKDEQEHVIFTATLKTTKGAELPLSLVVKGAAGQ